VLNIENLQVHYGRIEALKGVSFSLAEGEIVTLIGANGAGKSTTLKTISGLLRASAGKITFMGRDITTLRPSAIVNMGIAHVPEGRRVFPRMTVEENLEMGAFVRKDQKGIKEDMDRVFQTFPILKERRTQIAGTLSGGEQQMLAIGRGLMTRPRLLLLDEPSLGLAPILVEQIFQIIDDIHKQGTPILLVEQNAYLALQVANRGYVLETGSVVLEGDAKDLLNNEHVKKAYLGE